MSHLSGACDSSSTGDVKLGDILKLHQLVADPGAEIVQAMGVVSLRFPEVWKSVIANGDARTLAQAHFNKAQSKVDFDAFAIKDDLTPASDDYESQLHKIGLCFHVQCRFGERENRRVLDKALAASVAKLKAESVSGQGQYFAAMLRAHFPLSHSAAAFANLCASKSGGDPCENDWGGTLAKGLKGGDTDREARRSRLRTLSANSALFSEDILRQILRGAIQDNDEAWRADLASAIPTSIWVKALKSALPSKEEERQKDLRYRLEIATYLYIRSGEVQFLEAVHAHTADKAVRAIICADETPVYMKGWRYYDFVCLIHQKVPQKTGSRDLLSFNASTPHGLAAALCLTVGVAEAVVDGAAELREVRSILRRTLRGETLNGLVCGVMDAESKSGVASTLKASQKALRAVRVALLAQLIQARHGTATHTDSVRLSEAIATCEGTNLRYDEASRARVALIMDLKAQKASAVSELCESDRK